VVVVMFNCTFLCPRSLKGHYVFTLFVPLSVLTFVLCQLLGASHADRRPARRRASQLPCKNGIVRALRRARPMALYKYVYDYDYDTVAVNEHGCTSVHISSVAYEAVD